MNTEQLISRLAADTPPERSSPTRALMLAAAVACVFAGAAMLLTVGPRPDIATAAGTWRFDMKFVVTLTLAATALLLLRRAIYPEGLEKAPLWTIFAAPVVLLAAVAVELSLLPAAHWGATALGTNWWHCLTLVPAFGIVPLAIGLWGIRQGAPTRPMLSGLLAGLFAGGIAATAYAANCTDDSPLFVVAWYPIGILGLGIVGAQAGRIVLRW
jgi:hypothetical protein